MFSPSAGVGGEDVEAWVYAIVAAAVRPPERLTVAEWADRHREVPAESGSPFPGKWRTDRTPHLLEMMEALSPSDPATDIFIKKSAQVGVSEIALNTVFHAIDNEPQPILYVLPSLDQALLFSRQKLGPAIEACDTIRAKVLPETTKGQRGSTQTFKAFAGGYLQIANAHSSSSLQMISARLLLCDEVTEYPDDAGGRGDPVEQAIARTIAFTRRRPKRAFYATPGAKATCRIERGWQTSDQRRLYTACPSCGMYQVLAPKRLRWDSDTAPHGAYFECAANGCVIENSSLDAMMRDRGGRLWVKTYKDDDDPEGNPAPPEIIAPEDFEAWRERDSRGRPAGFHVWQAQSTLADWDGIVASQVKAVTPEARRKHVQQVLGEPYEEKGEAPDAEKLLLSRERRGLPSIPRGYPVLTGAVDVQGDRLEWAVYAWGAGMGSALVDYSIIAGATHEPEVWSQLRELITKRFGVQDDRRGGLQADLWAIDAGYQSNRVYRFCDELGGMAGRVVPIMGEQTGGVKASVAPIVSKPRAVHYHWDGKKVDGAVERFDLGTWPLKVELHSALRLSLKGPDEAGQWSRGAIRFGEGCDQEFFDQITAEALISQTDRHGRTRQQWVKSRARNEQTDLWCYARAAAELLELGPLTDEEWQKIAEARGVDAQGATQGDLFSPQAEIAREVRESDTTAPGGGAQAADPWINTGSGRWI